MSGLNWKMMLLPMIGILIALMAILYMAPSADASIVGTPFPAPGSDWIIDTDTTVLGETLALNGSINVTPGYSLFMKNGVLTIESSTPGEHGIEVQADSIDEGLLELSEMTIKAKNAAEGWYFTIDGSANIHDGVKLLNVQDGVQIFSSSVTLDDVEVLAQGMYGVYVSNCDPTIINCDISNENEVEGTWNGYQSRPDKAWGLWVSGTSTAPAEPTLENLNIHVKIIDTWSHSVSSSSGYEYMYAYGMYASHVDLGVLKDITVTFELGVKATMTYTGATFYFRPYIYAYGIQLTGATVVDDFDNVVIDTSTYLIDPNVAGPTNGYIYNYFYFYGLHNSISNPGSVPGTISGLTIRGHQPATNLNAPFRTEYQYFNGRGIYWMPSSTPPPGGYIFDGILLEDVSIQRMFDLRNSWDFTLRESVIKDCMFPRNTASYIFYTQNWNYKITIENNTIKDNSHFSGYLFYLYYSRADVKIVDNNITDNQMAYFMYTYQMQAGYKMDFKNNLFTSNTVTSYFMYVYYFRGTFTMTGNVFAGNQHNSYWMYNYQQYGTFIMTGNEIRGNQWNSYFNYIYYLRGSMTITDNNYTENTANSWWMYLNYMQASGSFLFEDNRLWNNKLGGGIYIYSNYGRPVFKNNLFEDNTITTATYQLFYLYYNRNDYEIVGNSILNNTFSSSAFRVYYFGYYARSEFNVYNNDFIGNEADTDNINNGLIQFDYTRQDVTVRENYFEGNEANGIVNYRPYPNYAYTFTVESNEFVNNSGKCIVYSEIDNMNVRVRSNTGTGNDDYCLYLEQVSTTINGPNMVEVEMNNFTGNPGGGIFLRTCAYDSKYGLSYGNPNQVISVRNNILLDNGRNGWALAVLGVYKQPNLKGNDYAGSAMGHYLGLINDDPRRAVFSVSYRNFVVDGDDDGMTALGFDGIDADFFYCTMLNFTEVLFARDCSVNVWWSAVPESPGRTEEGGRIFVYNHVEVLVTWANASGVDSGIPVDGATVAFQAANSEYMKPFTTDSEGRYGPVVLSSWISIDGRSEAWAPYDATVSKGNVSSRQLGHVIGERLWPENPMHLILVDHRVPEVIISNPQDATVLSASDVLVEGFLFEVGSGIAVFDAQTELMDPDRWDPVSPETFWRYMVWGMPDGMHTIKVRAADLAGNWNTSTVNFIVDLREPELEVWLEYKNTTDIPGPPYFVWDDEIVINGTYSDDYASLEHIRIRINGIWQTIAMDSLGRIFTFHELSQGLNIIIIDATDTAGNRASVEFYITLDRFGPVLYIHYPLQNESVPWTKIELTGLTEPDMLVNAMIATSAGTFRNTTVSGMDGTFSLEMELFEGYQRIIVDVADEAGNEVVITRDVLCDTTPPDFEMEQPSPGENVVTNQIQYTIIGTMTVEPDAEIIINGQQVPHTGRFERTLVLQEGENHVEILAIDEVGNRKTEHLTIVRDTVKPQLQVLAPEGEYLLTQSALVHFSGTVTGADNTGGGVTIEHRGISYPVTLVSGDWSGTAVWEYDLTLGAADLDQDIDVKASDMAGNEQVWTCHVVYDIIPPSLSLEALPSSVDEPFVLIEGITDEIIRTVHVQGVPYQVEDGVISVLWSLSAGTNGILVEVSDEAGNVQNESFTVFYEYDEYIPPSPIQEEEDRGLLIWSGIILAVALTIIATTVILYQTSKRRW